MKNKDIVLFGCGKIATHFYKENKDELQIQYAVSNNEKEQIFTPEDSVVYEVKRPESKTEIKQDVCMIICVSDYGTIAEQLMLLGYIPFVDFIDYELAAVLLKKKKIVLLYGFCHLRGIKDCLKESAAFEEEYQPFFYPNYIVQNAYQQARFHYLIENCEVIIYGMAVSTENYQKNEAVLKRIRKNVKKICLHAVYFGNYFPQYKREFNALNKYAVKCEGQDYTPFSYGDSWLNQCIEEGMKIDDIIEQVYNDDIYKRGFVLEYAEREWRRLRFQEKHSDFKIVDYIEKNYKKRRLFRNEAHMENEILFQYAMQVLEQLGCKKDMQIPVQTLLYCSQHVIYPCVAKTLELEWDVLQEPLEVYTYNGWKRMNALEYIKKYVEVCSEIKELQHNYFLPGRI